MPHVLSMAVKIIILITLKVQILRDLLKLSQGSLLELDRTAGELMDIKVNNTVIAKGEVVETSEGKYGITVVEIVAPLDRIKPA